MTTKKWKQPSRKGEYPTFKENLGTRLGFKAKRQRQHQHKSDLLNLANKATGVLDHRVSCKSAGLNNNEEPHIRGSKEKTPFGQKILGP